jgi:aldehyde:ferredoxin oxidoreductase
LGKALRSILIEKHEDSEICAIGIAGENLVRYASIIHPRLNGRSGVSGRGGIGAVMGSKNLKAIVVQRSSRHKEDIYSPEQLKEIMTRIQERLSEKLGHFTTIGTASGVKDFNTLGGFGTRNLREEVFEFATNINGDTLRDKYYRKNVACFSCPVACGKLCEVDGKLMKNPEYESIYSLGSMVGVSDPEAIIRANNICDEYGLDTMSMGVTIAFAMECWDKGYLNLLKTDGRMPNFGDSDMVMDLIRVTAYRKGFGDMLAEGSRRMAELLGGNAWHYAHQVKGLELAGHSARMVKTLAIGYATNTRGGSHQDARARYGPGMDTYEGKVELAIQTQNLSSVGDSLVMCRFLMETGLGRELNDEYSILINAVTGWKPDAKELSDIGERIFNLERMFNNREGITSKDDILPFKVMHEEIPEGPHKGFRVPPEKLQAMLQNYYILRGWEENGTPKIDTLKRLGLN